MRAAWITLRKELLSYCCSPVSYLIAVVFYLYRGFEVHAVATGFHLFEGDLDMFTSATYQIGSTGLMVLLVPGILTMRCFAEERRTGSMETLMTAPVREHEIVLGKWLAASAFYALLWLPTVPLLWLMAQGPFLDAELAFAPVFTAYLGMFLLSSLFLAFGCFASSLTDNVLLAAILSILFNLGLLQLHRQIHPYVEPWLGNFHVRELYDKLNVGDHFNHWFARGLVDTSQIAFFVGGIAFFLFLTVLSLQWRRVR